MKTIEERAYDYAKVTTWDDIDGYPSDIYATNAYNAYVEGAKEQKAIDEEEINKLYSIMEKSASVLGIGTKWFNEDARRDAMEELKQEILNYLSDY